MQSDTRKLLAIGGALFLTGAAAAALMLTAFGGVTHQGPHTNSGWIALIVALGCTPLGLLTIFLGVAKVIGERRSS